MPTGKCGSILGLNMFLDPILWAEKYFYFDSSSMYQGRWRLEREPWLADITLAFVAKVYLQ